MKRNRIAFALAVAMASVIGAWQARARVAGGPAAASCYAVFDGVDLAPGSKNKVVCADGDACDGDGTVNGSCTFTPSVCVFQTDIAGCTPLPITKFRGNGTKKLTLPPTGLSTPTCAAASNLVIKIKGKHKSAKKTIQLTAQVSGKPKSDKNKITFQCNKSGTTTTTLPPGNCANNPAGGPRQLDFTILGTGTDLDTGFSGVSHNFPVIEGAKLSLCLTECDASTNPVCKASGSTGQNSLNSPTFGPPLPLFAANVPVCVVNRFQDPTVQGTVNVQTGEYQSTVNGSPTPIVLLSDIYNTSATQVCPKCSGGSIGATGSCDSGPNQGQRCTVGGQVRVVNGAINELYRLSNDCPPGGQQGSKTGTVTVTLPVTTGTDSRTGLCPGQSKHDQCNTFGATCTSNCEGQPDPKGGINQWCCTDASKTPCFPTNPNSGEPNHAIVRTGTPLPPTPAWPDPTYPKTGDSVKTVATFCIGDTGSSTINQVAGLPGPGAVIFNGKQDWLGNTP